MKSQFCSIVKDLLPPEFQKLSLFEPFCEQAAAALAFNLQESLRNAGEVKGSVIELDEEAKEEIVIDTLYPLYDHIKKGLGEEPGEDAPFVETQSQVLLQGLKKIPNQAIVVPMYTCSSKGKGKKSQKQAQKGPKVINPETGSKITFGGRLFKTLVTKDLLTEEGDFTEAGRDIYDDIVSKRPKKIPHPTRKGGKINLGGEAYTRALKEGYTYNEETEVWTSPEGEEGPSSAGEEKEKASSHVKKAPSRSKPKKKKTPSEKIPHPKRKGQQIVKDGAAHKTLKEEGWEYDDEEGEWTQKNEDLEETEEITEEEADQ